MNFQDRLLVSKVELEMTDAEYTRKLNAIDRLLNDPDVPMEPAKVWSLLAGDRARAGHPNARPARGRPRTQQEYAMLLRSERCSVPLVFRLRFGPVPSAGRASSLRDPPKPSSQRS